MCRLFYSLICVVVLFGRTDTQAQCNFHHTYDVDSGFNAAFTVLENSGSFYIAGNSLDLSSGSSFFIKKIDSSGAVVWENDSNYSPYGTDKGLDLIKLPSGEIGCVGTHHDSLENARNTLLFEVDGSGDISNVASINHGFNDFGQEVLVDHSGELFIAGTVSDSTFSNTYAYLSKTNASGQIQWQVPLILDSINYPHKMIYDHDSTILISGHHKVSANVDDYDIFLAKFDRNGNEIWRRSYNDLDAEGNGAVTLANDGGYIICGSIGTSTTDFRGYLIKTDSQGVFQWEKEIDAGPYDDGFFAIEPHPNGGYFAMGQCFKWHSGNSNDMSWVWLSRLNDQGDTLWNRFYNYYNGLYDEIPYDMKITSDGGAVVTGYVLGNAIPTNNDAFVLKVDSMGCEIPGCHVGLEENVEALAVKVYPNPSNGNVFVEVESEAIRNGVIDLYDLMGKHVVSYPLSSNSAVTTLSLNNLADGLFLYQIRFGSKVVTSGKLNIIR